MSSEMLGFGVGCLMTGLALGLSLFNVIFGGRAKTAYAGHVPPQAMPEPSRPAPPMPAIKPSRHEGDELSQAFTALSCDVQALTCQIAKLRSEIDRAAQDARHNHLLKI